MTSSAGWRFVLIGRPIPLEEAAWICNHGPDRRSPSSQRGLLNDGDVERGLLLNVGHRRSGTLAPETAGCTVKSVRFVARHGDDGGSRRRHASR